MRAVRETLFIVVVLVATTVAVPAAMLVSASQGGADQSGVYLVIGAQSGTRENIILKANGTLVGPKVALFGQFAQGDSEFEIRARDLGAWLVLPAQRLFLICGQLGA